MKKIIILSILFTCPFILYSQLTHILSFGKLQISNSKVNPDYVEVTVDNLSEKIAEKGLPMLPVQSLNFSVPFNSEIKSIKIVNLKTETIQLDKKILPFQGEEPIQQSVKKNFVPPNNSISHYPAEQVSVIGDGYYDYTNQIITLEVCPFQYQVKNNQLLFYSSFDILITLKEKMNNKSNQIKKQRNEKEQKLYDNSLHSLILNSGDIQKNSFSDTEILPNLRSTTQALGYEYVIITSSKLAPAFEKFVTWKKRKGINIGIVTMEYIRSNYTGDLTSQIYDDAGKLRQYLFDAYKNGTAFALLGGDKNVVPIRLGSAKDNPGSADTYTYVVPTDLYFADFNGNWNVDKDQYYGEPLNDKPDYFSEIFVGRILCSTSEHVENWTNKVISYESNPGNGDFAYLRKAFYTQADQMQEGDWASKLKLTFTMFSTNTIFEETYNGVKNSSSSGTPQFPTGKDIMNEFNKNYGLVSFMGHGNPCAVAVATKGYNDEDADKHRVYNFEQQHSIYNIRESSLANMKNDKYPNIYYSISCSGIPYDDAEPYHTGHTENTGKCFTVKYKSGSAAFLGNTREGWINTSLDLFKLFGNEINKGNYSLGVAEANSLALINSRHLKYSNNLSGCPEMEMWTSTPSLFSGVSVSESGSTVSVNTGGVSGCKVCVMSSFDNGSSYFQVQKNVSNCSFSNVAKPYYVTITKHNYIPYLYPNNTYIQNQIYSSGNYVVNGQNIYAGSNVTTSKPTGAVVVGGSSSVVLDADNETVLDKGFEVSRGATLEVK